MYTLGRIIVTGPIRAFCVPAIAAAVMLAGCSLYEPRELEGEYVLSTVAGEALPAIVVDNGFAVLRVIADTLRLYGDGTGVRITVVDITSEVTIDGTEPRHRWEEGFSYRVTVGRFEAEFPCPPNASCIAPPHLVGTLGDAGPILTFAVGWRVPLAYSRISR